MFEQFYQKDYSGNADNLFLRYKILIINILHIESHNFKAMSSNISPKHSISKNRIIFSKISNWHSFNYFYKKQC